jgi:GDSL-like lipase/acylhydrolase family protein
VRWIVVGMAALLVVVCLCAPVFGLGLIKEERDYAGPMKKVAAKFRGAAGVVIHVGDSITYANPYGQWARQGKGKTKADRDVLLWMHTHRNNKLDGWYLARVDRPGGRSDTAVSGIRIDQFLRGGKGGVPPLRRIVKLYNPQVVVLMLGTNGVSANRAAYRYKAEMEQAIKLFLDNGTVVVLSTIPPHYKHEQLGKEYNKALKGLARKHGLPMIDYYGQIVQLQPNNWNGTILRKNNVHPTDGRLASGYPSDQNFKKSGYLLRGWLSVQKIRQVKETVLDSIKRK